MKFRISRLLAIAALVFCFLASAQVLAQNAYITNSESNTVSVIDTASNTVTATIPVSAFPEGVAVSSDGSKVYVTNFYAGSVSVIATASNTVTAIISLDGFLHAVAVSPDGSKVYVTNNPGTSYSGSVSVIDTASNTVTATIRGDFFCLTPWP